MKKMLFMAMMAMTMVACSSETPELPDNGTENERPVDKEEVGNVNPSLANLVDVHKAMADAFNNLPTATKKDLKQFMGDYSFVNSSYKNNKYIIQFADNTVSVLDLNSYSTTGSRAVTPIAKGAASRGTEKADSLLSNEKVLLWEAAPFGGSIAGKVGELMEAYAGTENVVRLSGAECTWQSLMQLSEYATVVFNGLGADGGWLVTGQEYIEQLDYSSMKKYIGIYSAVVDKKLKHYYMVNADFISENMAPMIERGVVFNASSSSADGDALAQAFAKIGYPTYIGFDNMVPEEWAVEKAELFFTGMMGVRLSTGDAFKNGVGEAYEYMLDNNNKVKVAGVLKGDKKLYSTFTAMTDMIAVNNILEYYKCDESISYESLLADGKIVLDYYGRVNMLDLGDAGLEGVIAPQFSWLTKLFMLNLDNNALSGEIPSFMGEFEQMSSLLLNDNQLTGNIPESFKGYYENNGFVNLTGNKMEGQIPFGKYTDIKVFFTFDRKYSYDSDGTVTTNDHGLWFADEPIQ